MKIIELKCPQCGAQLSVDGSLKQCTCKYCNQMILIDDEVQHIQYDNMGQSGYDFEMGRLRATDDYKEEKIRKAQEAIESRKREEERQKREAEEKLRLEKEKRRRESIQRIKDILEGLKRFIIAIIYGIIWLVKNIVSFVMKHKKICLPIIGLFVMLLILITNPTVRMKWYNMQAGSASDPNKRIELYEKALGEKENVDSWLGLLKVSMESDSGDLSYYLNHLEQNYSDNEEYIAFVDENTPSAPVASLPDGTFDRWTELSYSTDNGCEVFYSINDGEEETYTETLKINKNGDYIYKAYAKNKMGLKSESISNHYVISANVPEPVIFDKEENEYLEDTEISMEQAEGLTIYYTTDGSEPDKSSSIYEEPIMCSRGITDIKAVVYGDKDVTSDISEIKVKVRYPTHIGEGVSASGYKYDYCCIDLGIIKYDLLGNYCDYVAMGACYGLVFHEGNLYYFSDGYLYRYNEETEETEVVANASAGKAAIAYGKIWYNQGEEMILHSMNLDGSDDKTYSEPQGAVAFDVADGILYISDGWNMYRFNENGSIDNIIPLQKLKDIRDGICAMSSVIVEGDTAYLGTDMLEKFRDNHISPLVGVHPSNISCHVLGMTGSKIYYSTHDNLNNVEDSICYYDIESGDTGVCNGKRLYFVSGGYYEEGGFDTQLIRHVE